jgi:hypothetical protein
MNQGLEGRRLLQLVATLRRRESHALEAVAGLVAKCLRANENPATLAGSVYALLRPVKLLPHRCCEAGETETGSRT